MELETKPLSWWLICKILGMFEPRSQFNASEKNQFLLFDFSVLRINRQVITKMKP